MAGQMIDGQHSGAQILVVEDDLNLLEGIKTVLELEGYDVLTAENGQMALNLLQSRPTPPALIVSDIMMPLMSGIELFHAVREDNRFVTVPFIFLTARGERSDVRQGKMLGVDDYLIKPFDADDLLIAISARLQRQRALDNVRENEVSAIKRNILNILHHEFRTPLSYVVGYADMLSNSDSLSLSDAEMLTFLKGVNSGALRLRRLVENFILLVEMQTGDAASNYDKRRTRLNDLRDLLYEARTFVLDNQEFDKCHIEIYDPLLPVVCDPVYLRAAVVELLSNAVKFAKRQAVTLRAYARGEGEMVIEVQDHGRGIPPNEQEHIFEPFYQIHREKYEDQGSGAGLAIVKSVMDLHGGRIELDSEVGVGSTFRLVLPAAQR